MISIPNLPARISLYNLSKVAGVTPQALLQLHKNGYLKVTEVTCESCGHGPVRMVSRDEAVRYLQNRMNRQAKAAAKVAAK